MGCRGPVSSSKKQKPGSHVMNFPSPHSGLRTVLIQFPAGCRTKPRAKAAGTGTVRSPQPSPQELGGHPQHTVSKRESLPHDPTMSDPRAPAQNPNHVQYVHSRQSHAVSLQYYSYTTPLLQDSPMPLGVHETLTSRDLMPAIFTSQAKF